MKKWRHILLTSYFWFLYGVFGKGQLISKYPFGVIVATKIPMKFFLRISIPQWIFLLYRRLQKIEQVEPDHCDRYQNNCNKNCN